ncbi:MAG: hypothetical protein FWF59_00375 [Turicibacter sp.]|nr:hypothetical protein [Turicibacter sp.]
MPNMYDLKLIIELMWYQIRAMIVLGRQKPRERWLLTGIYSECELCRFC